jgi:hypothetical protein
MSLNFDLSSIEYFKLNPDEMWIKVNNGDGEYEDVNTKTKSLIFGCMSVGVGQINKTTAAEWYARYKLLEKFEGHYLYSTYKEGEQLVKYLLTPDVLIQHYGLSTNVSKITAANWVSNLLRHTYDRKLKTMSASDVKAYLSVFKMEFNDYVEKLEEEKVVVDEKIEV